jgi:two-component system NtrC family sensor kinase
MRAFQHGSSRCSAHIHSSRRHLTKPDGERGPYGGTLAAAAARRADLSCSSARAAADGAARRPDLGGAVINLRVRVVLIVAVPAAVLVAGHGLLRLWQEEAQLRAEDSRAVALGALATQIAVENALRDRQILDVRRLLIELVERQEAVDRIRLFDRSLRPTLVSNPLDIGDVVVVEPLRSVIATGTPYGFYQRIGLQSVHYYFAPIRGPDGEIVGGMELVRLASGIDRRLEAAFRDILVRLGLLVATLIVLITLALQRQVIRPVAVLVEGLQRLGRGQTDRLLPVTRRDELGRAAEAFNETAGHLDAARARLLAESERSLELERQLQRAASLAVAGKLTSALAHEVGTPLNVIAGRAEVALKSLTTDSPARADLAIVGAQIDRITRIINSLLDTVRPQAPVARPCRIDGLFDPLLPLFHHAARAGGIALTSSSAPDLPTLHADPGQLQQVLTNLVMNAIEATPPEGRVSLAVTPGVRGGRPGVAIAVSDTGAGIPAAALPHVFDPFFTTKPRGQGTGLGLAISRDIVSAHGGDIRLESEEGRGTTVTVWLPAGGRE